MGKCKFDALRSALLTSGQCAFSGTYQYTAAVKDVIIVFCSPWLTLLLNFLITAEGHSNGVCTHSSQTGHSQCHSLSTLVDGAFPYFNQMGCEMAFGRPGWCMSTLHFEFRFRPDPVCRGNENVMSLSHGSMLCALNNRALLRFTSKRKRFDRPQM